MFNRKSKCVALLICILVFSLVFIGCSNKSEAEKKAEEKTFTLKLSHPANTNHPYNTGAEEFKKLVEAGTGGKVTIQIFPNNQLGSPKDVAQALQLGTCDMGILGTAYLTSYVEKFGVLDLPFIFSTYEQAYTFLDSEYAKEVLYKPLESKNIKLLSCFSGGFRVMFNSTRPINKPGDFKGLKIRIMESQVYIDLMETLGGKPVALPWDDLYSSMQQKIVDAAEAGVAQIWSQKFYDVTKYLSITNHSITVLPIMITKQKWDALPAEYQKVIQDAAQKAAVVERKAYEDSEKVMIDKLKNEGHMSINQADTASLQEAVKPVWEKYAKVFGQDLINKAAGK